MKNFPGKEVFPKRKNTWKEWKSCNQISEPKNQPMWIVALINFIGKCRFTFYTQIYMHICMTLEKSLRIESNGHRIIIHKKKQHINTL